MDEEARAQMGLLASNDFMNALSAVIEGKDPDYTAS
jgi:hypothetical protein